MLKKVIYFLYPNPQRFTVWGCDGCDAQEIYHPLTLNDVKRTSQIMNKISAHNITDDSPPYLATFTTVKTATRSSLAASSLIVHKRLWTTNELTVGCLLNKLRGSCLLELSALRFPLGGNPAAKNLHLPPRCRCWCCCPSWTMSCSSSSWPRRPPAVASTAFCAPSPLPPPSG